MRLSPPANLLGRLRVLPDTCVEFTGYVMPSGYGYVWNGRKQEYAHRVMYELMIGPIPEGMSIDHLCRNRVCVNPGHLEAVTHRENVRRGTSPTGQNARKTHCKNGHAFTETNTYIYEKGRRCRACNAAIWRAKHGS